LTFIWIEKRAPWPREDMGRRSFGCQKGKLRKVPGTEKGTGKKRVIG